MARGGGFLAVNGRPLTLSADEAFDLVMEVAEGTLDVEAIAERLGATPAR